MKTSVSELTSTTFPSSRSNSPTRESLTENDSVSSTRESAVMLITRVNGGGLPLNDGVNVRISETAVKSWPAEERGGRNGEREGRREEGSGISTYPGVINKVEAKQRLNKKTLFSKEKRVALGGI